MSLDAHLDFHIFIHTPFVYYLLPCPKISANQIPMECTPISPMTTPFYLFKLDSLCQLITEITSYFFFGMWAKPNEANFQTLFKHVFSCEHTCSLLLKQTSSLHSRITCYYKHPLKESRTKAISASGSEMGRNLSNVRGEWYPNTYMKFCRRQDIYGREN